MRAKSENQMIKLLGTKFNLNVVPREEFDGDAFGLWIRDDICKPETNYYNYSDATMEDNKLNDFLTKCGWYASPYDSETIMLYKI